MRFSFNNVSHYAKKDKWCGIPYEMAAEEF